MAQFPRPGPRPHEHISRDRRGPAPRWCGAANFGRAGVARLDGRRRSTRDPARLCADRHRSRHRNDVGRRADPRPGCTAPGLEHLGVLARPKLTGRRGIQIWVPIAAGPTFEDTAHMGRGSCPASVAGGWFPELVSWKWDVARARAAWPGWTTPRTFTTRPSSRPTAPRRGGGGGAPISAPIEWDELDDPELRPDSVNDPHRHGSPGRARRPRFRALLGSRQVLPPDPLATLPRAGARRGAAAKTASGLRSNPAGVRQGHYDE